MTAHRRAAQDSDVDGISALSSRDATITWLTSVGYEAPREETRGEPAEAFVPPPPVAPPPVAFPSTPPRSTEITPATGLRVSNSRPELRPDPITDPWQPVARRRAVVARSWLSLLAGSLVCALLTLLGSTFVPNTYASGALVRVTAGTGALSSRDSVTASNDLAAQFSQLIEAAEVKDAAAAKAGVSVAEVDGHLSAAVVSNQNLIKVTATASSAERAQKIAVGVSAVLTVAARESLKDTVTPVVREQLAQLDETIAKAQVDLRASQKAAARTEVGSAKQVGAQAEVNAQIGKIQQLQYRQLQLQQDSIIDNASRQVVLADLGSAGPAAKQSPQPFLYALIAFAVAMVVGAQVLVARSTTRRRVD